MSRGNPISVLPPLMGPSCSCQVSRAELGDTGRYTCEALNQAGRSEKHYNLNIWGEGLGGWSGLPPPAPWGDAASVVPGHRLSPLSVPLPFQPTTHPRLSPFFCSSSVPPAFPSREPRTLTVTEGQPTRLSCECRGIPFPKITWKKDGMIASLAQPCPQCPFALAWCPSSQIN